jgi:hypothetical protein
MRAAAYAEVPASIFPKRRPRLAESMCIEGLCCIRSLSTAKQTIKEIEAFERDQRRKATQRAPTIKSIIIADGGIRAHQWGVPPVGENQETRWIANESNRAGGPPLSADEWRVGCSVEATVLCRSNLAARGGRNVVQRGLPHVHSQQGSHLRELG